MAMEFVELYTNKFNEHQSKEFYKYWPVQHDIVDYEKSQKAT